MADSVTRNMTPIESLWQTVEAEAKLAVKDRWVLRRVLPHGAHDLSVGVETSDGRRLLVLRTARQALPRAQALPECRGLEVFVRQGSSPDIGVLGVVLKEKRFADVFSALATDLAGRVEVAPSAGDAVAALLGQLRRWQAFLAAASEGLSEEACRGLWGELHFLREHLLPAFGLSVVAAWQGSRAAHQDFQFAGVAVEVKTSAAKNPQTVRIASERQLDVTAVSALFLHHLSLDVRVAGGESLPAMVASMRALLADDPNARESLESGLLAAGWLDAIAERYAGRGYTVRGSSFFRVAPGFPRIVEADLIEGVGDVTYALSVSVCAPFIVPPPEVLRVIAKFFKDESMP